MHLIPILAAAQKAHVSVTEALPHLMGMLMVLVTLAILWGVCALTAKLIQILVPAPAAKPAPTAPAAPQQPAPVTAGGIAPEIVAVIAAAVTTVAGKSHRIVSIKRQSTSWEKAGRQSVLTSHRIR